MQASGPREQVIFDRTKTYSVQAVWCGARTRVPEEVRTTSVSTTVCAPEATAAGGEPATTAVRAPARRISGARLMHQQNAHGGPRLQEGWSTTQRSTTGASVAGVEARAPAPSERHTWSDQR